MDISRLISVPFKNRLQTLHDILLYWFLGSPLVSHTETEKLCTTIPSKSSQELNDGSIVCPKFNVKCESLEECMVLVLEDAEWDVCDEGEVKYDK